MKVLVATKEGQGLRKNDFFFTKEGEVVKFGFDCDGENVDGGCGCRRSLVGVDTSLSSTTFKVVNLDVDGKDIENTIFLSLKEHGWLDALGIEPSRRLSAAIAKDVISVAFKFNEGDIIERRGDIFQKRFCGS